MGLLRGRDFSLIETDVVAVTIKIGTIIPFAGVTPPTGWLFCHGQGLNVNTFSKLFNVIFFTYGSSGDLQTFNLPDLRGRCVVGKDDMGGSFAGRMTLGLSGINGTVLGAAGGEQIHTVSLAQLALHGHATRMADDTEGNGDGGIMAGNEIRIENFPAFTGTLANTQGRQITGEGGGSSHLNVQPSIILNYIIKYE